MSELYHPRHMSPAFWWLAGIVAVAFHVGCVALALLPTHRDDEPDLGAPAIEIGVELASPKLDPTDLPVGPDTEAAVPSPAMVEQKAVIEKTDLTKATPTETDDPDRIVSPNETEKPKEEEPKITTMPTPASTEFDSLGGNRCTDPAGGAGSDAISCSFSGNRRKRTSPEGNLAKGTCGASEQIQTLSAGSLSPERRGNYQFRT